MDSDKRRERRAHLQAMRATEPPLRGVPIEVQRWGDRQAADADYTPGTKRAQEAHPSDGRPELTKSQWEIRRAEARVDMLSTVLGEDYTDLDPAIGEERRWALDFDPDTDHAHTLLKLRAIEDALDDLWPSPCGSSTGPSQWWRVDLECEDYDDGSTLPDDLLGEMPLPQDRRPFFDIRQGKARFAPRFAEREVTDGNR